jgi:hypothetical protein
VRVPASLIGKKVRCPRCESTYTAKAPDDAVDEVEVLDEEPAPRRRRPAPPPGDVEDDDRPRRARLRREAEYDDYEEEYDDRPRRLSRSEVRQRVQTPAIGLLVTGWLGLVLSVVGLIIFVIGLVMALGEVADMRKAGNIRAEIKWAYVFGRFAGPAVAIAWSAAVINGASKMKNLESIGTARTAAILGMFPCTFCITGLPFGIWALVVLSDSQVQRGFR